MPCVTVCPTPNGLPMASTTSPTRSGSSGRAKVIEGGTVTRGWIGVGVQNITKELAESLKLPVANGVLITQVERGGPAGKAGVRLGDVLLSVNGRRVADTSTMLNLIAGLEPGQQAGLRLTRDQAEIDVTVTIGRRPRPPQRK